MVENPPAKEGDTGSTPDQEDPTCRGITKRMHHKH